MTVTVPYGTAVSAMVATFSISDDASANPASPATLNLSTPKNITVTAQDNSTKVWTVTVNITPNDAKEITSFSVDGFNGVIDSAGQCHDRDRTIRYPVSAMVATFSISDDASANPASPATLNLSTPKNITVTAQDNSTKVWTVTVNITPNDAKEITSFSVDGFNGVIDSPVSAITVTVPYGTQSAQWSLLSLSLMMPRLILLHGLLLTFIPGGYYRHRSG